MIFTAFLQDCERRKVMFFECMYTHHSLTSSAVGCRACQRMMRDLHDLQMNLPREGNITFNKSFYWFSFFLFEKCDLVEIFIGSCFNSYITGLEHDVKRRECRSGYRECIVGSSRLSACGASCTMLQNYNGSAWT